MKGADHDEREAVSLVRHCLGAPKREASEHYLPQAYGIESQLPSPLPTAAFGVLVCAAPRRALPASPH